MITEIKHASGDYGPYALGKARDRQGQVEECFFTCNSKKMQFPTGLAAGHACNWAGRYDANKPENGIKMYFGSMCQRDVSPQVPQQAPPQAPAQQSFKDEPYHVPVGQPQAPPQPPQAPMAPQGGRDATGVSIERQACYKGTCELAARRPDLIKNEADFFDWLGHGHRWIETGTVDFQVNHVPTEPADWSREQAPTDPNQDDSDLPRELRANYQG